MKVNRGISLLEIVFAITLLAVIVPTIFGMFFSNSSVSKNLSMRAKMREAADDAKSFIRLSDYNSVHDIVRNSELFAIEEIDDDGLLTRNFVKYESIGDKSKCNFVAKFEVIDSPDGAKLSADASTDCSIPLQCKVYHIKRRNQSLMAKNEQLKYDMEYGLFIEKNR